MILSQLCSAGTLPFLYGDHEFCGRNKWIKLLFFYSATLFLPFPVLARKDAGNVTKGWASLLSQDPVYPPLTTPVFDLLTAADGKDMSLEL